MQLRARSQIQNWTSGPSFLHQSLTTSTLIDGMSMKASAYLMIFHFSKCSFRSLQQMLNNVAIHGNSNPKRLCHLPSFCLRQLGQSVMNCNNFQSLPLLVVPTLTGEVAELEFDFGPSPSSAATSKIAVSSGPTKESAHTGTQTRRAGRGSRGCSLVSGVS